KEACEHILGYLLIEDLLQSSPCRIFKANRETPDLAVIEEACLLGLKGMRLAKANATRKNLHQFLRRVAGQPGNKCRPWLMPAGDDSVSFTSGYYFMPIVLPIRCEWS